MKTLVLGDIHGRDCWKQIIEKENPDRVIFIGDYVSTHEDISEEQQIYNLEDILNYKEQNPDKVFLLRGNHDLQHLGYDWAECSGLFRNVREYLTEFRDRFLQDTQWIVRDEDVVFSHSGISNTWLEQNELNLDTLNEQEPSEVFSFQPDHWGDYSGNSVTQPCVWIRPGALVNDMYPINQVVGHTPVRKITNIKDIDRNPCNLEYDLYLCDNLPNEYLIIDNNSYIIKQNDTTNISQD